MTTRRILAVFTIVLTAAALSVTSSANRVDSEFGGLAQVQHIQQATASPDLSDYPGGANGTSNGFLSAAQRGEPVGADGTSGGSMSPFSLSKP